jgi:integrase
VVLRTPPPTLAVRPPVSLCLIMTGSLLPPFIPRGRHIRRDQHGRIAFMDARTVSNVLAARAEQAGLDEAPCAHDFRRPFIGELLDAGVDLATAQALVGHSSPAATAKYDRRPERARRAAVDKLATPDAVPLPGAAPRHRKAALGG